MKKTKWDEVRKMKTLQAIGFMLYILGIVSLVNITYYSFYSYSITLGCILVGMGLIIFFSDSNHYVKIKYFLTGKKGTTK